MAETSSSGGSHDDHMASRKAEEAALRRYQAVHWLECVVGPLGVPSEPTEREFISCLRNGIILCNVINKIQPGTIPKVVEAHVPVESESVWDAMPLPAYQYFENVRNFLVAVEELKLPAFEASDLERENFEAGSAARIADCILALKAYHEWKEWSGGKGVYKHVTVKSPLVLHSAGKNFYKPSAQPCRRLDLSPADAKQSLTDSIVKALAEKMVDSKENMNDNFLTSLQEGDQDPVQIFNKILSRCLEEKLQKKYPELISQDILGKAVESHVQPTSILKENSSKKKCWKAQSKKGNSDHWRLIKTQEKDLSGIKVLWSQTKREFEDLQCQLMNDLNSLGSLAEEMSTSALGYEKVVQENRKLYNMVQDLKGNIRVYCRIRPLLDLEAKSIVDFDGEDGSLVVIDPSKPPSEGRKAFRFNRVYGPTSTQDEVFKDAQPLVRSVLDGYNVCILAYGETGSGKTHTMYGDPSGISEKEMGISFFALNDLFHMVDMRRDIVSYELHVQVVEICNEQIRDLLAEDSACQDESNLPDVTSHYVKSNVDAINLVKRIHSRKTNNLSSCSHSIVTVHVKGRDTSGHILRGCLHLVDLAGSGEDDKSLSCLKDVITSLSQKSSCVHYRNSKLTSLLQDALGGRAKILVFTHVIPEGDSFTKTVSTLNFAQRISTIELGGAQSNKMNTEVMELKQEIELLKSALGDKDARSPQPNKQLRSPCEKASLIPQRTPVKSRRLSMETPVSMKTEKMPKSPTGRQKVTTETTPQQSLRMNIDNPSARKTDRVRDSVTGIRHKEPRSPVKKQLVEGSFPRSRRLSIENSLIIRSEKTQKMKEPKSPCEGNKGVKKGTPPRTRRLSIENPSSVRARIDSRLDTKTPQTSLRSRRLSLEGPKERKREYVTSVDVTVSSSAYITTMEIPKSPPTSSNLNAPTFTDCAAKFPSVQHPKAPEQQNVIKQEIQSVVQPGINVSVDSQTPGVARSTNGKGSQIKRSLRTIGKLINGSDKRSQNKLESSSTKNKDVANEPKSPPASTARVLRRQSLTNLPPLGSNRRSSLGGANDKRNAKTPPPVRSSTKLTKRRI